MKSKSEAEQKFLESLHSGIAPTTIKEFIKQLRLIAQNIKKTKS